MAVEHPQRKLAAILSADVVGFSRLVSLDEEGTMRHLQEIRAGLIDPSIAAYRGRIFKTMGDGLLVEFASVVDATRCAIEVQDRMLVLNANVGSERRIEFRVGVHLGDVMVQPDGDLLGDGVNIAARLEGVAEPGRVCLSGAAYEQVRDKLQESFIDLGEVAVKNIARPIRIFASRTGSVTAAAEPIVAKATKAEQPRFSIVVLPFVNMSGDPGHEYFADGVTESLTTDLSRIVDAFVIARSTAFTYKGKPTNAKEIARELNVRYVLEGSIQRTHSRMRVNVQLVDAETGSHLWAERFDKPEADLFDMQDEIVSRVAAQLEMEVIVAESRRAQGVANPDAMDLVFRGSAALYAGWSPKHLHIARAFFERAFALDPSNLRALHGTAVVEIIATGNFQVDDREARLASVEKTLLKILSLEPANARAYWSLGALLLNTKRHHESIAAFERALALDRNLASVHAELGSAKLFIDRAEDTEAHVRTALRLSPRDIFAFDWYVIGGVSKAFLGAYEEAAIWFNQSIEANRNHPLAHFFLAALLEHVGRSGAARASVEAGLALDERFSIRRLRATMLSDSPTYMKFYEGFLSALRKAGVPEG